MFYGFYNYFITKYANNKIIIVIFTKKAIYPPYTLRSRVNRMWRVKKEGKQLENKNNMK